jgi:uncharacterized membrane protein
MAASKTQSKQASSAKPAAKSDTNILYIFAYFLGWLSGIVVYITEGQKNKRMKFHAVQAILYGVVVTIVWFIIGWALFFVAWIIILLAWLYGLYIGYMAYQGTDMSIPVIGDFAKQYSS